MPSLFILSDPTGLLKLANASTSIAIPAVIKINFLPKDAILYFSNNCLTKTASPIFFIVFFFLFFANKNITSIKGTKANKYKKNMC